MSPHPFLMHILHDDRSRMLEATLGLQPASEEEDDLQTPVSTGWHRWMSYVHLFLRVTRKPANRKRAELPV